MLSMLSGPELAAAFTEAMRLKKEKSHVTQQQLATEFGVKQASISEWGKNGRIAKKHLNRLVDYFSDVVPPEHWGLASNDASGARALIRPDDDERTAAALRELAQFFRELSPYDQAALLQEAHDRASRAMGDRLLAEKFGVKGYASDGRLPPIFRDLERRRAARAEVSSDLVESPLSSTRGHRLPRPANDDSEEGAQ